jgi:peptidoglycan/LPS O-acetylase OafA/YrhL
MTSWLMSYEFLKSIALFDAAAQPMIIALLFGCMVLGATCMSGQACPGEKVWRPISRLSYSLYLVHFPLIPVSLTAASALQPWPVSFWIIYLATAFAAAAWLHFVVEKPFLILKDRGFGASRLAKPV